MLTVDVGSEIWVGGIRKEIGFKKNSWVDLTKSGLGKYEKWVVRWVIFWVLGCEFVS